MHSEEATVFGAIWASCLRNTWPLLRHVIRIFMVFFRCMCADTGCKHSRQVSLSARQRETGDPGEGRMPVPVSPWQVWERLPGAVPPKARSASLLGGGVAGTLGGRGCGSKGDPAEGQLSRLWVWLHRPVLESVLFWGPLPRSARSPDWGNTNTAVWFPQGRSVLGLARRHPVLLQRLLRHPQTHLYFLQHLHRAPVPRVWDGGGWLLCNYLYTGGRTI